MVETVKNAFVCTYTNCNRVMATLATFRLHRKYHKRKVRVHSETKCVIPGCVWTGKSVSIRKHLKNKHKD